MLPFWNEVPVYIFQVFARSIKSAIPAQCRSSPSPTQASKRLRRRETETRRTARRDSPKWPNAGASAHRDWMMMVHKEHDHFEGIGFAELLDMGDADTLEEQRPSRVRGGNEMKQTRLIRSSLCCFVPFRFTSFFISA